MGDIGSVIALGKFQNMVSDLVHLTMVFTVLWIFGYKHSRFLARESGAESGHPHVTNDVNMHGETVPR